MPAYLLMIQADEDDRYLTESLLQEMHGTIPMHFIGGISEMDQCIKDHGLPAVILLNNQDHRHKALELVKYFKQDAKLAHIPVVVLGEITTADYIKNYYRAGVNTYITKPSSIAGMHMKIRVFLDYWFEVAEIQQQLE